jgi:hypothetical protein
MVIQARKRFVVAFVVAVMLALFVREATAQVIATPEACKNSTPSDWAWWENLCWNYPSAMPAMHRGFVIR